MPGTHPATVERPSEDKLREHQPKRRGRPRGSTKTDEERKPVSQRMIPRTFRCDQERWDYLKSACGSEEGVSALLRGWIDDDRERSAKVQSLIV